MPSRQGTRLFLPKLMGMNIGRKKVPKVTILAYFSFFLNFHHLLFSCILAILGSPKMARMYELLTLLS